MKRMIFPAILILSMLLASCGTGATPTTTSLATEPAGVATVTPDLCSAANLPAEVARANKLMREFDDYSSLASNTPQAQLINLIPEMQRIVRDTQDLQVPACLQTLKEYEIAHMKLVVQVLIAFLNTTNANPQTINAGIEKARELHAKYDIEMARLLGITLVVPPTRTPGAGETPAANEVPAATALVVFVTNSGSTGINLRASPALDAAEAGQLAAQVSTAAIGKSADAQWIKVEIPGQPGQTAWVFAALVQLSVPIEQLPVTE
jgi:hypothetical protein